MADAAGQAAVHLAVAVPLLPGSTLPLCSSGAGPASAWWTCHPSGRRRTSRPSAGQVDTGIELHRRECCRSGAGNSAQRA